MRKQPWITSVADGLEKNYILKASVNGCRTEDVSKMRFQCDCLKASCLCLSPSVFVSVCVAVHLPQSYENWKRFFERIARFSALCKSGWMTMGLLKPLGSPNAYPIYIIDLVATLIDLWKSLYFTQWSVKLVYIDTRSNTRQTHTHTHHTGMK